jgi:hypothetical protein
MAALPKTPKKPLEKGGTAVPEREKAKVLLVWKAPIRPFKKRNREFFSTAGAIVFLVTVILIFLKEWFLILVIIAFLFLAFVLFTTEPEKVEHKITNRGIETGGRKYLWDELGDFWFTSQLGNEVLNVGTPFRFPGRLVFLLGGEKKAKFEKLLGRFLSLEEPRPTLTEKAGKWLVKKVPLEEMGKVPRKKA